jgi:ubiquitin-protein ligase
MQSSTPRGRRLISDYEALSNLASETSALTFEISARGENGIPESYIVTLYGPSLERIDTLFEYSIRVRENHQMLISFGPQYPRLMPQIQWLTPIFHPNISLGGSVCLGGYSTHWVPSLKLDQLCEMLWDMICFRNFNLESPFNRDAAIWMQQQKTFHFPLESRPLRQMRNSQSELLCNDPIPRTLESPQRQFTEAPSLKTHSSSKPDTEIVFFDSQKQ